jgi:hypothetical protein
MLQIELKTTIYTVLRKEELCCDNNKGKHELK